MCASIWNINILYDLYINVVIVTIKKNKTFVVHLSSQSTLPPFCKEQKAILTVDGGEKNPILPGARLERVHCIMGKMYES